MKNKILTACLTTCALAFGSQLRAQTAAPTGPFVYILATDPTALEGTSTGAFTLIRNGDTNADLTVNVEIVGSASNGVDYALITNAIVIPTNFLAVDIPVNSIIDTNRRGNKTVVLRIETNADYEVGGSRTATVTIIDDVFNTPTPTVSITAPTNDSVFAYPASIIVTADASDPGAPIASVSFFADDDFLAKVTNAPYSITWTNARPGRHMLFARAVDNLNQSVLSSAVDITVTDILPSVDITTPTNGENFTAHEDIPISADVKDANTDATIESVSFYGNGRLLGSVTNAPYSIVWSNVPAGFYSLQAAAEDNSGQHGYSRRVEINVSGHAR
jgi:hypothetical protein